MLVFLNILREGINKTFLASTKYATPVSISSAQLTSL